MTQKLKTAVLLTGAAARISQEVAMLDKLMDPKGCGLKISQDDTLVAGFSSGSLNLAAINACLAQEVNLVGIPTTSKRYCSHSATAMFTK